MLKLQNHVKSYLYETLIFFNFKSLFSGLFLLFYAVPNDKLMLVDDTLTNCFFTGNTWFMYAIIFYKFIEENMKIFKDLGLEAEKFDKNDLPSRRVWDELLNKRKERKYFCPFCRTLFDSPDCYKMQWENNNLLHICAVCKDKRIEAKDYDEQKINNKKNYKPCGGGDKDAIEEFIEESVLELGKEGFSGEEICSITHFSHVRINSIISEIKPAIEILSIKEFFMNKLKTTRYDYEKLQTIAKKHKKDDKEKDFIKEFLNKAIEYGCNYDAISILFGMSKRGVTLAVREFEQKSTRGKLIQLNTRRKTQIIKIKPKRSLPVT